MLPGSLVVFALEWCCVRFAITVIQRRCTWFSFERVSQCFEFDDIEFYAI